MQIILKRSTLCAQPRLLQLTKKARYVMTGILPPQFYTGMAVKLPGVPNRDEPAWQCKKAFSLSLSRSLFAWLVFHW